MLASAAAPGTGGWPMLTEPAAVATRRRPGATPAANAAARADGAPASARASASTRDPEPRDDRGTTIAAATAVSVTPAAAEASVRAEFASFANGTGGAPAESGFRLKASGALAEDGRAGAPFAANSRNLVDALPKHWSGPAGPGPATESHLDEKARRHDLFPRFSPRRRASGPWSRRRSARRCSSTASSSPRCSACGAAQRSRGGERGGGPGERGVRRRAGGAREAAAAAGVAMQAHDAAVRDRPAAEVCHSRATGVPAALLPALADGFRRHASVAAADRGASLRQRAEALDALSRALLGALGAAAEFRAHRAALYPLPGGRGHRAAAPLGARALTRARRCARRRRQRRRSARSLRAAPRPSSRRRWARGCLRSRRRFWTRARRTSSPPRPARRSAPVAREEYVARDAKFSPRPRRRARRGWRAGPRAVGASADAVAAVAEAHFGYEQLAEVCEAVSHEAETARDPGAVAAAAARTHHYMRTLRGAPADGEGSFATFVFERARKHPGFAGTVGRRVAETLRNTPDEFYDELETCLEPHPSLLWVHQLRAEDYSGAARTARGLADAGASLAEPRFLSLTKLSLRRRRRERRGRRRRPRRRAHSTSIQSNSASARGGDDDAPAPPLRLVEACPRRVGARARPAGKRICLTGSPSSPRGRRFARPTSRSRRRQRRAAAETDHSFRSFAPSGGRGYVQRCARRSGARDAAVLRRGTRRGWRVAPRGDVGIGGPRLPVGHRAAASALRDAVGLYANGGGDDEMTSVMTPLLQMIFV